MHLHHPLNRSGLTALLEQWALAGRDPVPQDAAEPLSRWLSALDAIRLNGALASLDNPPPPRPPGGQRLAVHEIEAAVEREKTALTDLMTARIAPPKPARGRPDHTRPPALDPAVQTDFAPHGQRYLGLQKQMNARLDALRSQVRQHLVAAGGPALRQLAALDAAMEQVVGPQAQRLWASLPGWLEKRHKQLLGAHLQRMEAIGAEAAPPVHAIQDWQAPFEQDLRALFVAEMHARLQPIMGLLEAARNDDR